MAVFVRSCSPLPRLVNWHFMFLLKRYFAISPKTQFSRRLFAPTGFWAAVFVCSCLPLLRFLSWLFAFLSKCYLASNPSSLLDVFRPFRSYWTVFSFTAVHPDKGYSASCSFPVGYSYLAVYLNSQFSAQCISPRQGLLHGSFYFTAVRPDKGYSAGCSLSAGYSYLAIYSISTPGSLLNAFHSFRSYLAVVFVHSCSPRQGLLSWLFAS